MPSMFDRVLQECQSALEKIIKRLDTICDDPDFSRHWPDTVETLRDHQGDLVKLSDRLQHVSPAEAADEQVESRLTKLADVFPDVLEVLRRVTPEIAPDGMRRWLKHVVRILGTVLSMQVKAVWRALDMGPEREYTDAIADEIKQITRELVDFFNF